MGSIKDPGKALALVGLIHGWDFDLDKFMPELTDRLGLIAFQSETVAFDKTDYYTTEMGTDLVRQWWIFERPVGPDVLAGLKILSNEIEGRHRNEAGGRIVNIDPGIITLNNLILASTKNYSHRIYLGQGIFAEVTLIYRHGRFQTLEWTYPDYKTEVALAFFLKGRELLKDQLSKA